VVWHDFSYTFASHRVMAGVNLTVVKELMGHKTITMMLRYAHLASDFQREAINR
jgi:site-specific recombinase XerD